jgi:hypothetical protein
MFNCRNCGKSYESRKRYVEHIEVCEEDIQSLQSRQSGLSRGSRQTSTCTSAKPTSRHRPPEDSTRQEGKLRRAVADLMDERTRLKGELGKVETDLRARVHAHREDIASTQEYYQGQVTSLMNERDELAHQLKRHNDVIDDREKMRTEMMKKLVNERKKLESREATNTTQFTAEVDNLQNRLAEQTDNQEKERTSFVKKLNEQDSTYRQQITQITEQLKISNQALAEMREVVLSKNNEEVAFQRIIVEKDERMEKVMAEHISGVREKELWIGGLEERLVKEHESHKTSINQLRCKLEGKIREREISIQDMQNTREKEVSQMLSKLEGVEVESKKVIFREHAKIVAETQEQILKLEMSHASVMESTCSRATRKIEESQEEVGRIKKKLLQADKIREDALTKKERDVRIEQTSRIDELNKSIILHQETTDRAKIETNTVVGHLKTENDKMVKFVKDLELVIENQSREFENQRLECEATARVTLLETNTLVEHLKTENDRMVKARKESDLELTRIALDTDNVRTQFIASLNKQQSDLESVVKERELVIENLRREFENQCIQYETTARAKLLETSTVVGHLKTENSNTVNVLKDRELVIENLRREFDKHRIDCEATARNKLLETSTVVGHLKTENDNIMNALKDRELVIENLRREFDNQRIDCDATARAKLLETSTLVEHLKTENGNMTNAVKDRELVIENLRREFDNQRIECDATARAKLLETKTVMEHLKTENGNIMNAVKDRELVIENLRREFDNQRIECDATASAKLLETSTIVEHLKTENDNMVKAVKDSGLELTRMASDTARVRSQFIINLNKQQTDLENVVKERELVIDNLRIELENQNIECDTKIALANSITKTHADSESREIGRRDADLEKEREAHALFHISSEEAMNKMREILNTEEKTKITNLTNQYESKLKQIEDIAESMKNDFLKRLNVQKNDLEIEFEKIVQSKQNEAALVKQAMEQHAAQSDTEAMKRIQNLQDKLHTQAAEHEEVVRSKNNEAALVKQAMEQHMTKIGTETAKSIQNLQDKLHTQIPDHEVIVNKLQTQIMDHEILAKKQETEISILHDSVKSNTALYNRKETEWKKLEQEAIQNSHTEKTRELKTIIDQHEKHTNLIRKDFKDKMNILDILAKKQETEISILHDSVKSNTALYNRKEIEWKKLEKESLQNSHTEKTRELKTIIDQHEKDINLIRKDFKDKMNDQITKHKDECMNFKRDAEGEISRLRESLEDTRKDQDTLLDEQASLYEFRITHKEDELAQKTAVLTAREIELKSIPSDADLKIKKLREECIEKIKKGHVEIESVKATNIKLNGELKISNSALDNKITEIVSMKENNENLKKSFLVNINSQKHAMDKTLEGRDVIINKRDTRISELEAIIKKDRN